MELGDLRLEGSRSIQLSYGRNPRYNGIGWFTSQDNLPLNLRFKVAILAIMELGDLPNYQLELLALVQSRNPRYNGIGWFTNNAKRFQNLFFMSQSSL